MKRTCYIVLSAAAMTALATPAGAEQSIAKFRVGGKVRTICKVEFTNSTPAVTQNAVEFGNMTELCNQREGYRVVMQHPEGMEGARFEIGGAEVQLSSGTQTVVVDSEGPAFRVNNARLQLTGSSSNISTLYFRMEPRGQTY